MLLLQKLLADMHREATGAQYEIRLGW